MIKWRCSLRLPSAYERAAPSTERDTRDEGGPLRLCCDREQHETDRRSNAETVGAKSHHRWWIGSFEHGLFREGAGDSKTGLPFLRTLHIAVALRHPCRWSSIQLLRRLDGSPGPLPERGRLGCPLGRVAAQNEGVPNPFHLPGRSRRNRAPRRKFMRVGEALPPAERAIIVLW